MPASFIKIGGELISNAILMAVEVTQELNQHSSCYIECRQTEDIRFQVEDSLGKDVQVLTYDDEGAEHVAFDGFVLEGELEYELYGSYTARLTAVSRSYKLDCTPQEAYWRKKTLSDIAQALAGEDGLEAKVKCASKSPKNYVQWGETDFAFLKRIADDYQAWIRPTDGGIQICDSFQTGTSVEWRKEEGLLSFRMKGRLAQPSFQGTHYNARAMMSKTLRQIQKDADFTGASGPMVSAVQRASKAKLPSGHIPTDGRAATEQEFQELLERESMRAIGGNLVGFGESRNDQLQAGNLVNIQGPLDAQGSYGLIRVVHRWTPIGYTNQFWCTPWKKYVSPTAPIPQRIHGMVTGRVKDNNDPRKMGRLQVQYDWQEDGATGWARMVTPHAGGDRGFLFLPEVGDEVLIAFEHGDPERPYIVGSLWNGIDQAPRQEFWGADIDPNDVKRIVTKSGHRIQFSDKEGKESIVIATPSKLKISLIEKTDETNRPMILLYAADGDMAFSAPNGRIHFHSKFFSREVGGGSGTGNGAGFADAPGLRSALGSSPGTAVPQPQKRPTPSPPPARTQAGILTEAQATRAQRKYEALSSTDKERFDNLLAKANSDKEKDYIRKGLAAGNNVTDLKTFAARIRGKDDKWMRDNLRLTGSTKGTGVKQQWQSSCGPTTVQAVKGEMDPLYAMKLHDENRKISAALDKNATKLNPKLAAEQKTILESHGGKATPRATTGTGAWIESDLNKMKDVTGVIYNNKKVGTDIKQDHVMKSIDKGLHDGAPVPLVIGNKQGQYGHYVLVTGYDKDSYSIHDPWSGKTYSRTKEQIAKQQLDIAGWSQVTAIDEPSVAK